MEGGADGLMDLLGSPAAELQAALEENLQEANDARVVELDAGIAHPAEGDGQSESLQERKVGMDIEPLRVGAGEAVGDGQKLLADGVEIVQALLEAEILEVVRDQLVAQERRELLILLEEAVLEIGTEDMMAMLDLLDDGGELALHPAIEARAEDLGDLGGGEPPQADLAAALEELVDGKVPLEDEIATILDLIDGIEA
jgi:hypothetical protein